MSPTVLNPEQAVVPDDSDVELQKWLKEAEGAETLMDQVEAKANLLNAKVDALLAECNNSNNNNSNSNNNKAPSSQDESEAKSEETPDN